ncbi:COR domain-containing protein [Methylovulum psychrotolerans]|uniref:non-specific serine/threonine protein kinase n=1 Tax=Methylovulum psychrotolerans TaxID=1704499 RepID=A0A2S5CQV0_9GAMM|nr:COR domain-containing protein [Methylovulum psychrotolerans]POZ53168.1 GTP-binding protein [Methylovulum psychrotolerans]
MSELALRLIAENKETKATFLDLGNCGLTEVPEELGELVWLEELSFSGAWWDKNGRTASSNKDAPNKIDRLRPAPFVPLKKLRKLWLHSNYDDTSALTDLSPLSHLLSLQSLSIENTQVIDLSPLAGLATLQWLYVGKTPVSDLSPLAGLAALQWLVVSKTSVSDLSPLAGLVALQELDAEGTPVSDLSPLAGLAALQSLNVRGTPVSDLSPLTGLMALQVLDAGNTDVSDLSPLADLVALQSIDVAYTKVSDLSPLESLRKQGIPVKWATQEQGICVEDCPLTNTDLPAEIAKQGITAIVNYFQEQTSQGVDHLYEAKLLIVGEGGAGKTSLLRRLYQCDKPLPEATETTKGIDIYRHDFTLDNGRNFRLNVWDFGGQQIYHATHQFFLTKRSLYVLLDDTRKNNKTVQDEGFKYWLEVVDQLGDHSPVLIFQNEKGGRSKTIDEVGIKGRFANVKGVYQGNLEYPDTVDKLREALEFYAKQLPHIGEELPARWVAIRADIEERAQQQAYISQQDYFALYEKHLDFDRGKALHLSRYLHDLGVFLHFQDDPLLARTVILQNTWATEAVFKMLDDEIVKKAWGRFTLQDCQRVWQDSLYADMHPELLALMQMFELCYRLPDAGIEMWLTPQLLPPSKPQELNAWEKPGDLVLRYRYEFMPKGLINRLMVRQHRYVPESKLGWMTGVLFERDGTQLLAEIAPKGDEIALRARGAERKALLTIIAADLDALNESFRLNDKVEKWVPCHCRQCLTKAIPESFNQKRLLQRKRDGKLTVECPSSYEDVNVLELLDGIQNNKPPNWVQEYNNRKIPSNSTYLHGINARVKEKIKFRLQILDITCTESEKNSSFNIIELDGKTNIRQPNDKKILYYCNKDTEDFSLPLDTKNKIILRYSLDSIEEFLDSVETWINLKL